MTPYNTYDSEGNSSQYSLYFQKLDSYIMEQQKYGTSGECFIRLGTLVVRLVYHDAAFLGHIRKQLSFCMCRPAAHWDAALVLWHEEQLGALAEHLLGPGTHTPSSETPIRVQTSSGEHLTTICDEFIQAQDVRRSMYYYGVRDLLPEAFLKHGHMLVQLFSLILNQNRHTALVHAASVGLNGKGILLCARGQRGKSTLAVTAMLQGMEYVADDYLVLEQNESGLFASPIYSIIALSPLMYNTLYDRLDAKFVANNARQDKYVLNINGYSNMVRNHYPITAGMLPHITNAPEPSIEPIAKGQAVTQLIHSTITQMNQHRDTDAVRKLIRFLAPLDFYRINLCPHIQRNAECLRHFAENLHQ